jgi:STE24 endopeptidase
MVIRFLILSFIGILLGFNTILDALNMGASNTRLHRHGFLKRAMIRFLLGLALVYIMLVSEFASSLVTIIVLVTLVMLIVMIEFLFIRRSRLLKKMTALLSTLLSRYLLLMGLPLAVIAILVYYTNFLIYLIVLGGIIGFSFIVYSLIYKVFIYKLVRLVPYTMHYDETLYLHEPSLKADLFMVQSDKLMLPMNALFMGFFNSKRVLLTPKIIAYLSTKEVIAIIYHELGHYHHKHLRARLSIIALIVLAYLFIGFLFFNVPVLAFIGLPNTLFNLAIMLGLTLYLAESFIEIFMINMMHKQEYEADSYVKKHYHASHLISGLRKIKSIESEIIMHPLYQQLKVSHPSIKERILKLKA